MSSPLKKFEPRCFESQHMHPREWGLLHVLQRVTKGCKSILFFDGPTIATWFTGVSKSAIYESKDRLVDDGWLVPLNGKGRKRRSGSKRFESTQYRVLSHDEWIKTHKGKCQPFRNEGTESIPERGNGAIPESGNGTIPERGNGAIPEMRKNHSGTREEALYNPCSVKESSVKACSVGADPNSLDLNQGQKGSGVATLSTASIPEVGNGDHTLQTEPPRKVDWEEVQRRVEAQERERGVKQ